MAEYQGTAAPLTRRKDRQTCWRGSVAVHVWTGCGGEARYRYGSATKRVYAAGSRLLRVKGKLRGIGDLVM